MHKIDTDTAVGNEFVDGNEAASIKATRLNAKWFNTIQRELCNIVEQAGMALSENDDGQVQRAVLELVLQAMSSGLLRQIKMKGGYTIEIDSREGTFSIYDPEGSAGISFGFNEGNKFSFTDSVTFEGDASVMGNVNVDKSVIVKDSEGNGLKISDNGIAFENSDGTSVNTEIGFGSVKTAQIEAASVKVSDLLNVINGKFVVKDGEVRSKVKTIVQNEMAVTGRMEIQNSLKVTDQLHAGGASFDVIEAGEVRGCWSTGLYSSASQLPTDGVQTGSFAFAKNSHDVLKLYVYTGRGWTELNP